VDGGGNAPLVQQGNLIYEGAFRVPDGSFRGPNLTPWQFDRATFEYGGTALAFNPANNSLFVVGHDQAQLVAEIAIPTPIVSGPLAALNTAIVLQPFTDVTDRRMQLVNSDPLNPPEVPVNVGGLLPYQNKLYASVYIYYDGRGSQKLSHFVSSPNLSVMGDATGPYEVNRPECIPNVTCLGAGFFDGYFGHVPFEWQTALGGPVLNGNCCLGIIGRTSYGPAVFTVDPTSLGVTTPLPAKPLLYYPPAHPLLEPGLEPCLNRDTCNPFIDGWSESSTLLMVPPKSRASCSPKGHAAFSFSGATADSVTGPICPAAAGSAMASALQIPRSSGRYRPAKPTAIATTRRMVRRASTAIRITITCGPTTRATSRR